MKNLTMARIIAEKIEKNGGRAYFVGGFVRDRLCGTENKDIDIEVHGIEPSELCNILSELGSLIKTGKSFGVYSLRGYNIDIAMPRTEHLTGTKHTDFEINIDPQIGTQKAAIRRDFTINALMEDILTGEITDHFGGRQDLKNGIIRHVNDKSFCEDALRVLRGAQFAARFGFAIHPQTLKLFSKIDLSDLARERVMEELSKAMLKSLKPSVFFEVLRSADALDTWFPELKALIGIEQNPAYHAEGDVWTHTMMVIDEAANFRHLVTNPLGFMLSAVIHDLGKITCTVVIGGVIHAYRHETEGLPIIEKFLHRLTNENALIKYVLKLCEFHMKPRILAQNKSSIKSTNKMFDSVPDPTGLIYIAEADNRGKLPKREDKNQLEFLLKRRDMYLETMSKPHVMGKDLIDAGLTPDERFSEILSYAHKLRLAGVEKESALKQTLAYAKKLK